MRPDPLLDNKILYRLVSLTPNAQRMKPPFRWKTEQISTVSANNADQNNCRRQPEHYLFEISLLTDPTQVSSSSEDPMAKTTNYRSLLSHRPSSSPDKGELP